MLALCLAVGAGHLAGCSSVDVDACADAGNMTAHEREAKRCNGGFLSSLTQRDAVYRGDDTPRLWTGKSESTDGILNTAAINKPQTPASGQPFVGYVGTLRVNYEPDPARLGTDIGDLQQMRGPSFDPNETTALKFEKVDLVFFLKQTLGGILGVNYIAPDDMAGKVSFTTEQPIPKPQVLQVVRDVLGRNGYEMQLINGVYHIGRHEAILALTETSQAGRTGEQVTRIIRIPKGSATEISLFVKQLVGPDVSLGSANGGDAIVIRAPASQIDQVSQLVRSLSDGNFSEDRIAIVPLKRASPGKLAEELSNFYRERITANKLESVTITPLETQRAVLIATRDARLMAGVRKSIDQLDRAAGEEASLRIVQLVNAKSDDAVERLKAVFGIGDAAAKSAGPSSPKQADQPNAPSSKQQQPGSNVSPTAPRANPGDGEDDGSNMSTPGFAGKVTAPSASSKSSAKKGQTPVDMNPPGTQLSVNAGDAIRVASDPHNNAVMIFSDYPTFVKLRDFLKTIDVAEAQVVIEATIAEVSLNDDLQYGVQAYLNAHGISVGSGTSSAAMANPTSGTYIGGQGTIGKVKFGGMMQALQSITTVKVISSPYLTVLNGKTARLVVGDQIPFATRTVNSETNGTSTVTQQVESKDTGIVLEVTPRIQPNNAVSMTVDQSVSKAQENVLTGNLTPVISNRQVKSEVVVDSGNTILIGGLLQERLDKTESGVPLLRKMPVVGDLFTQKTDRATRVELIILITPRVVRNNTEIDEITRALRVQARVR